MITHLSVFLATVFGMGNTFSLDNSSPSFSSIAETAYMMNTRRVRRSTQGNWWLKGKISTYGFQISESWEPVTGGFSEVLHFYRENGEKQSHRIRGGTNQTNYSIQAVEALFRNVHYKHAYAFAYKVTISPLHVRNSGFFGIGSYGDNWYVRGVRTHVTFGDKLQLADWAPKNKPSRRSGSVGVGLENGIPSIAATVNFEISDLSVSSGSSVLQNEYETHYRVHGFNEYSAHDIVFFGFFTFFADESEERPSFNIAHDCFVYGREWFKLQKVNITRTV